MFLEKRFLSRPPAHSGFTLIELMIVIAIIAILVTIALPVFSTYSIRAKIGEGLSVANSAKTAISETCSSNRGLPAITNSLAGWNFNKSITANAYVQSIRASGPCTAPIITIITKNTGASPDPEITMTGTLLGGSGHIEWGCSSANTESYLLPTVCRATS